MKESIEVVGGRGTSIANGTAILDRDLPKSCSIDRTSQMLNFEKASKIHSKQQQKSNLESSPFSFNPCAIEIPNTD
jgi:hypothetical protein